jgi:23S rRNA (uridine2552-2'-O)-methyltransferase
LHKKTKPSSQKWLLRHLNDPYVHKAKDLGYRCRSAFKLAEINQKYPVVVPGMRVLDLGCAPGGWCQWALKVVGAGGYVMGVDLLPIEPLPGLVFVQGDITDVCVQERMGARAFADLGPHAHQKFDVIISDMAPSLSGHTGTDRLKMEALLTSVWTVAQQWLRLGGHMIVKVYHGDMMAIAHPFFGVKKYVKPPSSRPESREIYWVGQGYKGEKNV